MLGIQKSLDLAASSKGMKGLYRVLVCLCVYIYMYIYTERVWGSDLLFIVDTENPAWM